MQWITETSSSCLSGSFVPVVNVFSSPFTLSCCLGTTLLHSMPTGPSFLMCLYSRCCEAISHTAHSVGGPAHVTDGVTCWVPVGCGQGQMMTEVTPAAIQHSSPLTGMAYCTHMILDFVTLGVRQFFVSGLSCELHSLKEHLMPLATSNSPLPLPPGKTERSPGMAKCL